MPGIAAPAADLRQIARRLDAQLRANRRPAITDANSSTCKRCAWPRRPATGRRVPPLGGKARRTGTRRDLEDEIADVLIVTACFAERAGIDLNAAIAAKLTVIYSRGWREEDTLAGRPGRMGLPAVRGRLVRHPARGRAVPALPRREDGR